MMVDHLLTYTIPAAYSLLPAKLRSDQATAMLVAIGLHESGFTHRKQVGGPARGWWQFERIGTRDVLEHARSKDIAETVLDALCYAMPKATIARLAMDLADPLTHNDTLACCFARLKLWTLPKPLPPREEYGQMAFEQYIQLWKPGAYVKGSQETRQQLRAAFGHSYAEAWARVTATTS